MMTTLGRKTASRLASESSPAAYSNDDDDDYDREARATRLQEDHQGEAQNHEDDAETETDQSGEIKYHKNDAEKGQSDNADKNQSDKDLIMSAILDDLQRQAVRNHAKGRSDMIVRLFDQGKLVFSNSITSDTTRNISSGPLGHLHGSSAGKSGRKVGFMTWKEGFLRCEDWHRESQCEDLQRESQCEDLHRDSHTDRESHTDSENYRKRKRAKNPFLREIFPQNDSQSSVKESEELKEHKSEELKEHKSEEPKEHANAVKEGNKNQRQQRSALLGKFLERETGKTAFSAANLGSANFLHIPANLDATARKTICFRCWKELFVIFLGDKYKQLQHEHYATKYTKYQVEAWLGLLAVGVTGPVVLPTVAMGFLGKESFKEVYKQVLYAPSRPGERKQTSYKSNLKDQENCKVIKRNGPGYSALNAKERRNMRRHVYLKNENDIRGSLENAEEGGKAGSEDPGEGKRRDGEGKMRDEDPAEGNRRDGSLRRRFTPDAASGSRDCEGNGSAEASNGSPEEAEKVGKVQKGRNDKGGDNVRRGGNVRREDDVRRGTNKLRPVESSLSTSASSHSASPNESDSPSESPNENSEADSGAEASHGANEQ